MAIRNFPRKRRLKKSFGPDSETEKKILFSRRLKESPDPESSDTAQIFFTEQETTKKLGTMRRCSKHRKRSPSIFII